MDNDNSFNPAKPLKNQKALVTGASSGIREACALALGSAGASVLLNFHSDEAEANWVVERFDAMERSDHDSSGRWSRGSSARSQGSLENHSLHQISILIKPTN